MPSAAVLLAAIAWAQPPVAGPIEGPGEAPVEGPAEPAGAPTAPASEAPAEAGAGEAAPAASASTRRERRRARASTRSRRSRRGSRTATKAPADPTSVSVGRHNRGRLLNASQLTTDGNLRLKHPAGDQHYGTDELVAVLRGAADSVWARLPGSRLTVGDLSRHTGGRFRPHRSHQNGRDVDVGFYIRDLSGHEVVADRFFAFGLMGTTRHDPTWRFDDERNWLFVEHMLTQTDAPVQYMFVSRELRRRLLAEGSRRGVDAEILARAARVLYQPPAGGRHRDHFHIRVFCDPGDAPRCADEGPRHPWLRGASAIADAATRGLTGLEDVLSAVAFFSAPPEATAEGEAEEAEEERPARRRSRGRHRSRRSRRARH